MNNGGIQQLQAGDTLDATVSGPASVAMTNNNASPIVIGNAVYCDGAGTVDLAQSDASGTVEVLGLVSDVSIGAAASGTIQTDGVLSATTGQWDVIAGTTGGLAAGTVYYLDPDTPGYITSTAPTSGGEYVVRIGQAISTTELEISIEQPILL